MAFIREAEIWNMKRKKRDIARGLAYRMREGVLLLPASEKGNS